MERSKSERNETKQSNNNNHLNNEVTCLKEDDFLWGYKETNDAMEAKIKVRAKEVQQNHSVRFPPRVTKTKIADKNESTRESEKSDKSESKNEEIVVVDANDTEEEDRSSGESSRRWRSHRTVRCVLARSS